MFFVPFAWSAPSAEEVARFVRTVDERQAHAGDSKALVYLERKSRTGDLVYEAVVYRRDRDDKLAIVFVSPAAEAGRGYLLSDGNLFLWDPAAGRWERRSDREKIGGTDGLRSDFGAPGLVESYDASWVAEETLGSLSAHHLQLRMKPGAQVPYPRVDLWVDVASQTLLKRQDFAESGRLVRSTWYPQWTKVWSATEQAEVWFPKEIRIKDELEAGSLSSLVLRQVDLSPLPDSVFTKAWIEAGGR